MVLHHSGFPIRRSPDQCLFTAPRGLSQLVTSFFGSWCQGIHLMLFFAWTSLIDLSINYALSFIANNFLRLCYSPYFALLAKFVVINYTITERPSDFCHTFVLLRSLSEEQKWSFLIICSFLFFIRFSMNCEDNLYPLATTVFRCSRPKWTRTIDLTLIRRAL